MKEREGTEGGGRGFRDLVAWQKALGLVTAVYEVTREWPPEERFGLTAQVRRAAVSIPSNLAEGHGRSGPREFLHHTSIAFGSLCEVETQLLIAAQLTYCDDVTTEWIMGHVTEVRRLLRGLLRSLQAPQRTA